MEQARNVSNNVSQYTINQATGALSPMTTAAVAAGTSPCSITVDSSGKYAYVANVISNNVSQYTINQSTGALTPMTTPAVPAGMLPCSITTKTITIP